jgi:hypothetical protein
LTQKEEGVVVVQLQEFFDYKNKLMEHLLTNKDIVHLINDEIKFEDAQQLAYKQVFPCEYIPETLHDGSTFVCFDVDVQRAPNKTYLLPTIYVWVFAHRSRLRLPEGGVRTDALCHEICKQINGSKEYGLGELDLFCVKRFAPATDYQGKVMTFYAKDFNRLHNPNQYIPTNRKA